MDKNLFLKMAAALVVIMDEEEVRDILLGEGFAEHEIEAFLDTADSDTF